ncbi:MAG TPA: hypothetical protein VI279_02750 [Rhodocyclaceae bacterium]
MSYFYHGLPPEAAANMDQLSRLMYELRENRNRLLRHYQVPDEAALLARIEDGSIAEHPAYEHYLGAKTIAQTRAAVNAELKALLKNIGG